MNSVLVSGLRSAKDRKPFPVPPETPTFGFSGYAFLYPEAEFHHVHPRAYHRLTKRLDVDIVLFNPTSHMAPLLDMAVLARELRESGNAPVMVCLDGDICSHWMKYYPTIVAGFLDLFSASDFVACRNDYAVGVTQALTKTPAFWLPEVSTAVTDLSEAQRTGRPDKELVLAPASLATTYNTHRNVLGNHAVMIALREEFPDYRYVVLSRDDGLATNKELGNMTEVELLESIGLDAEVWTRFTHTDIYETFRNTKLMVNLDYETTMGHWLLDSAAFGVPALATEWTCGGRKLFPRTQAFPFDVGAAVDHGRRLLADPNAWEEESRKVKADSMFFHGDNVRDMLEEGIGVG